MLLTKCMLDCWPFDELTATDKKSDRAAKKNQIRLPVRSCKLRKCKNLVMMLTLMDAGRNKEPVMYYTKTVL